MLTGGTHASGIPQNQEFDHLNPLRASDNHLDRWLVEEITYASDECHLNKRQYTLVTHPCNISDCKNWNMTWSNLETCYFRKNSLFKI